MHIFGRYVFQSIGVKKLKENLQMDLVDQSTEDFCLCLNQGWAADIVNNWFREVDNNNDAGSQSSTNSFCELIKS